MGRIAEGQFPVLADVEIAPVRTRQAPGEGGAGTFRVAGRVGPTEVLVILVDRAGVQSAHRRRFVDRCDCHGYVQRGGVKSLVPRLHRHQVLITVGPGRTLIVGRTPERQRARLADPEFISVWPSHRPGNTSSLRVRGPVGVEARRPVLRLPQPGGRGTGRGDGRRFIDRRYRHRLFKGAVVPTVRRPHRHLVNVVPVGVGRAFVVRRVPEPQLTLFINDEVPSVRSRSAPEGNLGAGVLRVSGRVPGQNLHLVLVLRHTSGSTADPPYLRSLVHVCHRHHHGKCGGVGLVVPRLHRDVIDVVPARVPRESRSWAGWSL